jgi:hypothetical protein
MHLTFSHNFKFRPNIKTNQNGSKEIKTKQNKTKQKQTKQYKTIKSKQMKTE